MGIGTASINFKISPFSSSLTGMNLNSEDWENILKSSIMDKFDFKYLL